MRGMIFLSECRHFHVHIQFRRAVLELLPLQPRLLPAAVILNHWPFFLLVWARVVTDIFPNSHKQECGNSVALKCKSAGVQL